MAPSKLTNMVFDEVSIVRRPANQHAAIVFSKSAPDEGDEMPDVLYAEDGTEVNIDDLPIGTEIEMDDGSVWEVVPEDADDADDDPGEPDAGLGKSADDPDTDYVAMIAKAYSDAVDDEGRRDVIAKMARATAAAQRRADLAMTQIEKAQADAYLDSCIAKAQDYGFAGDRTEAFGVVLAKAMTVLEPDEIELLDDIFKSFAELIDTTMIGSEGGRPSEVLDLVDQFASGIVEKADGDVSKEAAFLAAFEERPELYQQYLDEKKGAF